MARAPRRASSRVPNIWRSAPTSSQRRLHQYARDCLRRAETREARIYAKIELLEDSMLGLG